MGRKPIVGIFSVVVNVFVVKRAVGALGERRTLMLGLGCGVIGFTIYGFAPSGVVFLMGLPIMALWALAMPSVQALVTRQVDPREQGRIQGALTSLASLAGILGPGVYTAVFAWFIGKRAMLARGGTWKP